MTDFSSQAAASSLMLQEIEQQPQTLEQTVRHEGQKARAFAERLRGREVHSIVLVARGSSDNAALYGRYLIEILTGIPVSLAAASVYTLYKNKPLLKKSLVIGISQSGEGEDINMVIEQAKQSGALTLGITNEAASTLARTADEVLLTHSGRERSVAATKTYTGQLLHFYMLATALGGVFDEARCNSIPEAVARALRVRPEIAEMAKRYTFMENCVVVGRGLMYGNTFEWALKLMETCYVVAERFSSADFFHGPLALVERHFPVLAFAQPGVALPGILELLDRLHELRADTFVVTGAREAVGLCSRSVVMPDQLDEFVAPIPYIVPAQLFAALLAAEKGLNPDAPRSISKVTRTL